MTPLVCRVRDRVRFLKLKATCAGLAATLFAGAGSVASAQPGEEQRFMRVAESESDAKFSLEVAIRAYKPVSGEGPTVYLASAVHLGEAEFYHELQTFLDGLDVVLFEQVRGPNAPEDPRWSGARDHDLKADLSRRRATLLATRIDEFRAQSGRYPESLVELREAAGEDAPAFIDPALIDAWGESYGYSVIDEGGEPVAFVVSLGADGRVGGVGVDTDLYASPDYLPEPKRVELRSRGMQPRLAKALGLQFQLAVMDHSAPTWRNADVTVTEVQQSLAEAGPQAAAQGEALFQALSGDGLMGRLSGVLIGLVRVSPTMREMTKTMLIETVPQMESGAMTDNPMFGDLMEVILDRRNDRVIADLKRVLREEPEVRTIGIIYGAGHLPGIEGALLSEMGYEPAAARWVKAMTADLGSLGLDASQARMMRDTVRRMVEAQMGR